MLNDSQGVAPGRGTVWRPLTKSEVLPTLNQGFFPSGLLDDSMEFGQVLGGGPIAGSDRCAATGLTHGDCTMHHLEDSRYCYYHSKVQQGVSEPEDQDSYPVWPLPKSGYVLLLDAVDAA